MPLSTQASLYQSLAEALAEPPDWLMGSGEEWVLFADALAIAQEEDDPVLYQIVSRLAEIPMEPLEKRRLRYEVLFSTTPYICLYESLARDGRLAGPSTFAVWQVYEAAGLMVADSQLPDHASVELAFLAYLATKEDESPSEARYWRKARRLFIQHHAGQWLPALGQALAHSGDEVYGSIGRLLAYILEWDLRHRRKRSAQARPLPILTQPEKCTLCGFCVQVCPTRAILIQETNDITALVVNDTACINCQQCSHTCPTGVLHLEKSLPDPSRRVIRQSLRAHCPACGQPTVSHAELETIAALIGEPAWLKYCLSCRTMGLEKTI